MLRRDGDWTVVMGAKIHHKGWGKVKPAAKSKRPPLVLHFRPTVMVHPKKQKHREFRELLHKHLGAVFDEGDDGPYGPQGTISGSGDGWDDCDG